jgi:hypothetical protein
MQPLLGRVCNDNHGSAGRHGWGRTRKGPRWLWVALAAHAVARTKAAIWPSTPGARAPSPEKAALAVAHSILVIAWQLLTSGQPYTDLDADSFVRRQTHQAYPDRLVRQLERMGHKVTWSQQQPDRLHVRLISRSGHLRPEDEGRQFQSSGGSTSRPPAGTLASFVSRAGEHMPWLAGCGRDSHPMGDCCQYLGLPHCKLTVAYAWNQSGQDDLRAAARLGGIRDRSSWSPDLEGDQYCKSSVGPFVPRSRERYLVRLVEADWMAKSYRPSPVTTEVTSKSTV